MLENPIIVALATAFVMGAIGFFAGWISSGSRIRRLKAECDELRAYADSIDVDFGGVHEISSELLNNADAISATAERMTRLANNLEQNRHSASSDDQSFAVVCAATGCTNKAPTWTMAYCSKCTRNWCSKHGRKGNQCPGCYHRPLT